MEKHETSLLGRIRQATIDSEAGTAYLLTIPVTSQFVFLLVMMFLLGISLGGSDVGGNTLTAWIYGRKSGPYISALFFFAGVGGLVSPLIAGWVLGNGYDLKIAYWITAIFVLPPLLWLLLVRSPANRAHEEEDKGSFNLRVLVTFGVIFFLIVGVEASFGNWIYTYFLLDVEANVRLAALVSSVFWLSLTFGRLVNIFLLSRLRPSLVTGLGIAGSFAGLLIILVSSGKQGGVFVGTAVMGLFLAAVAPTTITMAERRLHVTGKMMGVIWSFGSAGAILIPWLVGYAMERAGPPSMPVIFLTCLAVGFLIFVYLIRSTGNPPAASS